MTSLEQTANQAQAKSEATLPKAQQAAIIQLYKTSDEHRIIEASQKIGDGRSPFRRDTARLIHCSSFRRLQGKSQLFPSDENDFFRNRLTHSLEVAQIATGLAQDLNIGEIFVKNKIDIDLVNFAALAHDIGHPPFGHNGERALNKLMKDNGGFEGNAQTLRILGKLEKKATRNFPLESDTPIAFERYRDHRVGLNLTMRTLASVLKYDNIIKGSNDGKVTKGYYITEQDLVENIKSAVVGEKEYPNFRTIECSVMDIADDIAYSTYDIEDALKGGFLSTARLLAIGNDQKNNIIKDVNNKMKDHFEEEHCSLEPLSIEEFNAIIVEILGPILELPDIDMEGFSGNVRTAISVGAVYARSCELESNGYLRSDFTSKLVSKMMRGVYLVPNKSGITSMTKLRFRPEIFKMVEMLKRIAFKEVIASNRLKMAEYRGSEMIDFIFHALIKKDGGDQLLPADWQAIVRDSGDKHRTVCDFISGMTDRYCLEFYSRLIGVSAPSIQKPY